MTSKTPSTAHALGSLQKPIRDFPNLIHLAPPVAGPDNSIRDVVIALSQNPGAHAVFITDEADRLLGVVSESALDLDLMTLVLPQQVWLEIRDWEPRELMRASQGNARTARELMTRVESVTPDRPLRQALAIMSHRKDSYVTVVDEQGRLLGYLTLFETLASLLSTPA